MRCRARCSDRGRRPGTGRSRNIDPADPGETAQTIADLVLAAVRDANRAAGELQQEKMGPLASGIGALGGAGDVPGMPGIPGIGDFPDQPHGGEPRGGGELRG